MTLPRRLVHVLALALCLTACTGGEASADGTAWITDNTGRDGLRIYDAGRYGERQPVRLPRLDIRILAENEDLDVIVRRQLERL